MCTIYKWFKLFGVWGWMRKRCAEALIEAAEVLQGCEIRRQRQEAGILKISKHRVWGQHWKSSNLCQLYNKPTHKLYDNTSAQWEQRTTGCLVSGSTSVELAFFQWSTWRANSITAHCMPRQMPAAHTTIVNTHYTSITINDNDQSNTFLQTFTNYFTSTYLLSYKDKDLSEQYVTCRSAASLYHTLTHL